MVPGENDAALPLRGRAYFFAAICPLIHLDGLRWLMMDEYVRLCTICEEKLCSNFPRESYRIIFQSKYYLAGSV